MPRLSPYREKIQAENVARSLADPVANDLWKNVIRPAFAASGLSAAELGRLEVHYRGRLGATEAEVAASYGGSRRR